MSLRKYKIHTISHVTTAMNLYSASIEDLVKVDCFLDFQDTKESPMKMLFPVTDLLVSGHEAQSAFAKPFKWISVLEENKSPFLGSFLKYCKTLYAASRCGLLGLDMY